MAPSIGPEAGVWSTGAPILDLCDSAWFAVALRARYHGSAMPLQKQNIKKDLKSPAAKRALNEELFGLLAPRYDFINVVLSLGRDQAWKRLLVSCLPERADCCLDLACGTGDITFQLAAKYPGAKIVGLDLTEEMLKVARRRSRLSALLFVRADMERISLADASVDVLTGGYALRNAPHLESALEEVRRVLKPGGTAAFLDFSKPASPWLQRLECRLLDLWSRLWGRLLHGDAEAYGYIAESLREYPDRAALHAMLSAHGFTLVYSRRFYLGVLELTVAQRTL
jgi:ubiquinone/menaquinone biosynthesis methyltransferase